MEFLQKPPSSFRTVWGIQKDQITGFCQGLPNPGEPFRNLDPENHGSVREPAPFQIPLNGACTILVFVAENGKLGPSTQRLDSKSTAPRKGIQDKGSRYSIPKNRKEGFPDPV